MLPTKKAPATDYWQYTCNTMCGEYAIRYFWRSI